MRKGILADLGFAGGFMAITVWVIGTQFLTMPTGSTALAGAANYRTSDGWVDPCTVDPESAECGYYEQWLLNQQIFWLSHWATAYVHESSIMTVDRENEGMIGEWDLTVWLDAGLDYEDPDLTEQDVLDQIVATGTLDVAYAMDIAWDSDEYTDPDDGVVTTVDATLYITAALVEGQTGLISPVVGIMMQLEVANTLNEIETLYQFAFLNQMESIDDAIHSAQLIVDAAFDVLQSQSGETSSGMFGAALDPGGGTAQANGGTAPPGIGLVACPHAGEEEMTVECCECYSDYASCRGLCSAIMIAGIAICIGLGELALFSCAFFCTAIFLTFALPCILKCSKIVLLQIARCIGTMLLAYAACEGGCWILKQQCLSANGCKQ